MLNVGRLEAIVVNDWKALENADQAEPEVAEPKEPCRASWPR
jgi:hypothetical protein